jgi:hypothetical protein
MNVFDKMIEVIEARGWGKGNLVDEETGECCIIGAWGLANGIENINDDDVDVYERFKNSPEAELLLSCVEDKGLDKRSDRPGNWVKPDTKMFFFNDHSDTTQDDVIEVIQCAAKKSE